MDKKNINIKRVLKDYQLINKNPIDNIDIYVNPKKLYDWYFLIKGVEKTDYEGGYYIGRIELSENYPFTPPDYYFYTPNGRFKINVKICLSNSGFHSDEWKSSWTISAMLKGLLSIMLEEDDKSIGHIKDSSENRKKMADESVSYNMKNYKDIFVNFKRYVDNDGNIIKN